jgi:hypothetical protein
MLQIRKEQEDAFRSAARQRYFEKLRAHLEEVFPEKFADPAVPQPTDLWIEEGIKKAGTYQITAESEVTLFIDLMFSMGEDFDLKPANRGVRKILKRDTYDESEKMSLVYHLLGDASST